MENTNLNSHCYNCPSFKKSIFSNLTNDHVQELQENKKLLKFKKDSVLFNQGMLINGTYCIQHGIIKTTTITDDGKENIRNILKNGDIAGLVDLLSSNEFNHSYSSLKDSRVCFIEKNFFLQLSLKSTELSQTLLDRLSRQINQYAENELDLMYKKVKERVIHLILKLDQNFGIDDSGDRILDIDLNRSELASMLGIACETLIRVLTNLKEENIIEQKGKYILLKDRKRLEEKLQV